MRAFKLLKLVEAVTVVKKVEVENNVENMFMEWQELKRKEAILNTLSGKIGDRIKELEDSIKPIMRESQEQRVQIDKAAYKLSEYTRGYPRYKDAFEKALSYVNEETKTLLNEYLASVTTQSFISTIRSSDPELAAFIAGLKLDNVDSLLTKYTQIEGIGKLAEPTTFKKADESLGTFVKEAWTRIKGMFASVFGLFKSRRKAVQELVALANSLPK